MTEQYISFEIAKKLKGKGFYGECMSMYVTPKPYSGKGNPLEAKIAPHGRDSNYYEGYMYECEAPTVQMVRDWLRTEHKIDIVVMPSAVDKTFKPDTALYPVCDGEYEWLAMKGDVTQAVFGYNVNGKYCTSYKDACEAAVAYCIENYIKTI